MKKWQKKVGIGIALVLLTGGLFTGCGKSGSGTGDQKSTSQVDQKPDISKFMKINMTVFGKDQTDKELVLGELNKKLKEKANAEVSIEQITAVQALEKYRLYIAADADVDIMHTRITFARLLARAKGIAELDGLLEQYTPQTLKSFPEIAWEQSKVDGKIVMIPLGNRQTKAVRGIAYREDLRKKYNIPEIKKMEDFEAYFEAIAKNEKAMVPYYSTKEFGSLGEIYMKEKYSMISLAGSGIDDFVPAASGVGILSYDFKDKLPKIKVLPFTEEYGNYVQMAKRWYSKGFWTRDTLTNKTVNYDLLLKGATAAVSVNNYILDEQVIPGMKNTHPDWQIGFYYPSGQTPGFLYSGAGVMFKKNSEKLERALMVYDLLENDEEIYKTVIYGMKDKHYTVTEQGVYKALPEGIETSKHPYQPGFQIGGGFWNDKIGFKTERSKLFEESEQYFDKNVIFSPLLTMDASNEGITAEIAAVSEIMKQYAPLIALGIDADQLLPEYKNKLKAAGIDKILTELQKQVDTHMATAAGK